MAKLTQAEQRILRHPPTTATWECLATRLRDGVMARCGQYNLGMASKCWLCAKPKPRRVKLVWPVYEAACKKAGIEPGTRWPVREAPEETPPTKASTRRKK